MNAARLNIIFVMLKPISITKDQLICSIKFCSTRCISLMPWFSTNHSQNINLCQICALLRGLLL